MNVAARITPTSRLRAIASRHRLSLSQHPYPGKLITVCGVDGSGKSTAVRAVSDELARLGLTPTISVIPTERVRRDEVFRKMVSADWDGAAIDVDLYAMCLSMLGDLRQHLTSVVEPKLRDGGVVVCDRYIFTHLGELIARSPNPLDADLVQLLAHRFCQPDLALFTDVDAETAARRIQERGDSSDLPAVRELASAQVEAYRAVAEANGLTRLASELPLEQFQEAIREHTRACLAASKGSLA